MKRIFLITLLMLFAFSGCTGSEKINLAVFIENYNSISGNEIGFTSFTGQRRENDTEYTFFIKEGKDNILVTLTEKDNEITECRITLVKVDESLNKRNIDDESMALFNKAAKVVAISFSGIIENDFEDIINELTSDSESTEITGEYKNYNMIFISNELCTEFIIRNKWFFEEETTLKPEDINSFLNTAPIRTETVPHR